MYYQTIKMIYKVIKCPYCGNVQVSQATKVFKCVICNKSKKINPKSKLGLGVQVLFQTANPKEATLYVQEYKKQEYNKSIKNH